MLSRKLKTKTPKRPLAWANDLITIWRTAGPAEEAICLKSIINEVVNHRETPHYLSIDNYDLPQKIDGAMEPIKQNHWAAIVNKTIRSPGRRRFTLAHELFHFLSHRELQSRFGCTRSDINSFDTKTLEDEANAFAAQLLIPSDILRQLDAGSFCYETVKDAADNLGVSVTALAYKWVIESNKKIGFFQSRDGFFDKGRASTPAYNRGIYFKGGTEIPSASLTLDVHNGGQTGIQDMDAFVWHKNSGCRECVHQTDYEDYTYTFLDFSN